MKNRTKLLFPVLILSMIIPVIGISMVSAVSEKIMVSKVTDGSNNNDHTFQRETYLLNMYDEKMQEKSELEQNLATRENTYNDSIKNSKFIEFIKMSALLIEAKTIQEQINAIQEKIHIITHEYNKIQMENMKLYAINQELNVTSNMIQAEQQIPDDVVLDRIGMKSFSDNKKHDAFLSFVNHDFQDNGWNRAMLKENIRNYNIETKIGHDVDGYNLVALYAQRHILNGDYVPTESQRKFNEWAFAKYDIPQTLSSIDDNIDDIVGKNNRDLAVQLVKSLNNMIEHGNVGAEVHSNDPLFWSTIGNKSLCGYIEGCDPSAINFNSQGISNLALIDGSSIASITYHDHQGSIYITYNPCETSGSTCSEFGYHSGAGILTLEEAGPSHIQDWYIYVSMSIWGAPSNSVAVVFSEVYGPIAGGSLTGYDTDGNITKEGNLYNPNADNESQAWIRFTSYAYTT